MTLLKCKRANQASSKKKIPVIFEALVKKLHPEDLDRMPGRIYWVLLVGTKLVMNFCCWIASFFQCCGFASSLLGESGYGSRVSVTKNFTTKIGTAKNKIIFLCSKIAIYLSIGLLKGRPSHRRSLHPSLENIQRFKKWIIVGHFCPSRSGSRDHMESESTTLLFSGGSLILTNIYLLVGVSLPLWIWPHPFTSRPPLPLYAGAVEMLWIRIRNLLVCWYDLGSE